MELEQNVQRPLQIMSNGAFPRAELPPGEASPSDGFSGRNGPEHLAEAVQLDAAACEFIHN